MVCEILTAADHCTLWNLSWIIFNEYGSTYRHQIQFYLRKHQHQVFGIVKRSWNGPKSVFGWQIIKCIFFFHDPRICSLCQFDIVLFSSYSKYACRSCRCRTYNNIDTQLTCFEVKYSVDAMNYVETAILVLFVQRGLWKNEKKKNYR